MNSEFTLDYRFAVESPADAHHARAMNDFMENLPNPVGLECVQDGVPHSGELRVRAFGDIGLTECKFDAPEGSNTLFNIERARPYITRNHSFEFHVSIVLGGKNRLDMCGRTHIAKAGNFFVMDTDTPFGFHMLDRGHVLCIALPASWDRVGDTRLASVFGSMYSDGRWNSGLVNYARHLHSCPGALSSPHASEKLFDVIALSLNPRAKSEHQAGLLALIQNYIDTRYANPDFDPAAAAAAAGISVRHLHRLFTASGATFTEYLLEQRLAQARRMLSDVRHRQQTVLNIAFSCGFRDINHFGRRFRTRYGITPGEFREVSLRARPERTS